VLGERGDHAEGAQVVPGEDSRHGVGLGEELAGGVVAAALGRRRVQHVDLAREPVPVHGGLVAVDPLGAGVLAGVGDHRDAGMPERDQVIDDAFRALTKLYVNGESPSDELSTMTVALTKDKNTDTVITLDAQVALNALQAPQTVHSSAKLYTFDTNAESIAKIKSGAIQWAVDQQPYLQAMRRSTRSGCT
jgi:ABC-type sugar transport system substrate-binding protein